MECKLHIAADGEPIDIWYDETSVYQVSRNMLYLNKDEYTYDPNRGVITFKEPFLSRVTKNPNRKWWQFWKPKYVETIEFKLQL